MNYDMGAEMFKTERLEGLWCYEIHIKSGINEVDESYHLNGKGTHEIFSPCSANMVMKTN